MRPHYYFNEINRSSSIICIIMSFLILCSMTVKGRIAAEARPSVDSRELYFYTSQSTQEMRCSGTRLGFSSMRPPLTLRDWQGSSYGGGASRYTATEYHGSAPAAQPPGVHHPHHAPKHFNANEFNKEWPAAQAHTHYSTPPLHHYYSTHSPRQGTAASRLSSAPCSHDRSVVNYSRIAHTLIYTILF